MGDIEVGGGWVERLEQLPARRTIALAAAALACFLIFSLSSARRAPARIAPPATSQTPFASESPDIAGSAQGVVFVHVAGAVGAPGLYSLPLGMRVADAIEAAGGPGPKADLNLLNLAQLLTDGMKIEVPKRGESAPPVSPTSSTPGPGAPISLNSADQTLLETVPGIGEVRAAAIIAYREEHGGFQSVEELLEVPGIGPVILASIQDLVSL